MKHMHILHLGKYYPPAVGGIETVIYNLASGQIAEGHQVTVLCANHNPYAPTQLESQHEGLLKIVRAKSFGKLASTAISPSMVRVLERILRSEKVDIIHIHFPDPMAVLAFLIVSPKQPLVVHWHSDIIRQKLLGKLFEPFQRSLLKRAQKIIVASPEYGRTSLPLRSFQDKVQVIPYGISISARPQEKTLQSKDNSKIQIFSLGRHVSYKGFHYLIEAFQYLDEKYELIIGGDGPLWSEHQELVRNLKLSHRVRLLKSISDDEKQEFYFNCDIFCLPSVTRAEAFGLVLVEALSYSKPIISTSIPGAGTAWINEDQKTGVVVEPGSSEAIAKAIKNLVNRSDYPQMCENSRLRFEKEFSQPLMIERFNRLYLDLIQA